MFYTEDNLSKRRSVYNLNKNISIDDKTLIGLVKNCVKHCPSAFNVQSARVAMLFKEYHQRFWQMTWEAIENIAPVEKQESAKQKIDTFSAAYGTILFFEDTKPIAELKKQFPLYENNMDIWAEQANGMLQYMIWSTLAEQNIGASLQHYNELISEEFSLWLNLPKSWKIRAQMPFGGIAKMPEEKTFIPLEERVKIFG